MAVSDTSLAALLLTNRLVDVDAKPLSSSEYWRLIQRVGDPAVLLAGDAAAGLDDCGADVDGGAERVTRLLGAASAFAFERERLEQEGVSVISTFDSSFPRLLIERLGGSCPSFLTVAGPVEWLSAGGLGVVASRDATEPALAVARLAVQHAAGARLPLVGGLVPGIDHASMAVAFEHDAPVVAIAAEGMRVAAKNPEVRRRVHSVQLCIASPYGPAARFTAGNAIGRDRIVYALADVTLVMCAGNESGGTWQGAEEAVRRGFGHVAVWMGEGAGLGNASLVARGARPITELDSVFAWVGRPMAESPQEWPEHPQSSLF